MASMMHNPRDYKIDDNGITLSNPGGAEPHRIPWDTLILTLDALQDWTWRYSLDEEPDVKSVRDFNEVKEIMLFASMPITSPVEVPGSTQMPCDQCGQLVWLSPATKEVFDKINKKLMLCVSCLTHSLEKKKVSK